jgi:hypothetical protein
MFWRTAIILMCLCPALDAFGQSPKNGRYPRVYGWTGRPYGPTQAHYQYQRQYGRSWHGYGGNTVRSGHHTQNSVPYANGYPLGGSGYVYTPPSAYPFPVYANPSYGWPVSGWYGYQTMSYGSAIPWYAGVQVLPSPTIVAGPPARAENAALQAAAAEADRRWQAPVDLAEAPQPGPALVPSSPEARLRSLERRQLGDQWFQQQNFSQAYRRYKSAISAATDQAEPHFRLAFTLVALGHHAQAVDHLKQGLVRDTEWPHTGQRLERLYGPENTLVLTAHLHNVAEWVRADIRDPNRLFLLGVMLHFTDQPDKAATCFETALRLAGRGEHLKLFLRPAARVEKPVALANPAAAGDAEAAQAPQQPGLGIPPAPAPHQPPPIPVPPEARQRFRLNPTVVP